ncbi:hypothetical protein [Chryseobacterium turcicum]|uniref:DUF998 domain-containing protein n=1 Tax=Chryseobacterium turcicum TaxID=2898076 RepID=A0A9Q3YVT0_9FLAO|nr:hypothetical protein [Chryseobacterium turcicum]MCD1117791.1 hypothetical protein [Chryseobacterium turcicum]
MLSKVNHFFDAFFSPDKTVIRLRILIGITAFMLPISLISSSCFFDLEIQPSISHYNFTNFREIFTGCLMAIGFFMLCYKVPSKNKIEQILSTLAGIFAILIAFFPTTPVNTVNSLQINENYNQAVQKLITKQQMMVDCYGSNECVEDSLKKIYKTKIAFPKEKTPSKIYVDYSQYTLNGSFVKMDNSNDSFTKGYYNKFNATIHTASAFILFSILGILSLFIFPSKSCKRYKFWYRLFGALIFLSIIVLFVDFLMNKYNPNKTNIVLWCEVVMLFSFGASWLLKAREDYIMFKNLKRNNLE